MLAFQYCISYFLYATLTKSGILWRFLIVAHLKDTCFEKINFENFSVSLNTFNNAILDTFIEFFLLKFKFIIKPIKIQIKLVLIV